MQQIDIEEDDRCPFQLSHNELAQMTAAQHRFEDLGPPLLPPTATGHFRAAFRLPLTATPCECRPRAALWVRAHVGTGGIAGCDACEYPCDEGRCRSAFNATHVYSPAVLRAAGQRVPRQCGGLDGGPEECFSAGRAELGAQTCWEAAKKCSVHVPVPNEMISLALVQLSCTTSDCLLPRVLRKGQL